MMRISPITNNTNFTSNFRPIKPGQARKIAIMAAISTVIPDYKTVGPNILDIVQESEFLPKLESKDKNKDANKQSEQ